MSEQTGNPSAPAVPSSPQAPPPPSRKRGRRLGSARDVRNALAFVVRELEANRIDVGRARGMVYGLSTLAAVMQGGDLDERLARLEALVGAGAPSVAGGRRAA